MEEQPFAQTDAPHPAIGGNLMPCRHLWARALLTIHGIKRVIDMIAMHLRDNRAGPDGIKRGQIGLRHEAQRGGTRGLRQRRRSNARGPGKHRGPLQQMTTFHGRFLCCGLRFGDCRTPGTHHIGDAGAQPIRADADQIGASEIHRQHRVFDFRHLILGGQGG